MILCNNYYTILQFKPQKLRSNYSNIQLDDNNSMTDMRGT